MRWAMIPQQPKLSDGLFYAEKAVKHLFINPMIPDWIVVNKNGGLLLLLPAVKIRA
jgi:hypothetical protein